MIASTATAVLPVCRSPMISSRWPRPIGTMPSIAFRPGLQRLLDRAAIDDARARGARSASKLLRGNRALAVDRLAERVDDAPDHLFADRHRDDAARALDRVAFLDLRRAGRATRADAFFFEVQRDAEQLLGNSSISPAIGRSTP
jgi:hypothetical protein